MNKGCTGDPVFCHSLNLTPGLHNRWCKHPRSHSSQLIKLLGPVHPVTKYCVHTHERTHWHTNRNPTRWHLMFAEDDVRKPHLIPNPTSSGYSSTTMIIALRYIRPFFCIGRLIQTSLCFKLMQLSSSSAKVGVRMMSVHSALRLSLYRAQNASDQNILVLCSRHQELEIMHQTKSTLNTCLKLPNVFIIASFIFYRLLMFYGGWRTAWSVWHPPPELKR